MGAQMIKEYDYAVHMAPDSDWTLRVRRFNTITNAIDAMCKEGKEPDGNMLIEQDAAWAAIMDELQRDYDDVEVICNALADSGVARHSDSRLDPRTGRTPTLAPQYSNEYPF